MKDWDDISDDKNTKVFKHSHDGPEIAPHKRGWDRRKCKRNKSGPHLMQLASEHTARAATYRRSTVPGFHVWEKRPHTQIDKEYRCVFCSKKNVVSESVDYGEWVEVRRVVDRRQR